MCESDSRHFLPGSVSRYTVLPFLDIAYMSAESSELCRSTVGWGGKAWSWCPLNWAGLGCRVLGWVCGVENTNFSCNIPPCYAISRSLSLLPAYNYTRYLFLHILICIDNLSISRASNYGCVVRFENSCFEVTIVSTT